MNEVKKKLAKLGDVVAQQIRENPRSARSRCRVASVT
jgi:hypothetical protein